ncbi:MAG: acyltransferase [Phormidesmis sp.]
MFLNSINHFRAIAITIIVAGHCFYMVDATFNTLPERAFGNLIAGGTVLFVFISGFLFHHIFYKRYQFKKFMAGKLKKVLLPYTLLSIAPIVLLVMKQDAYYSLYDPQGSGFIATYLVPALKYYFTGRFLTAYWYIPFAMILFLLSPLHMGFIQLRFKWQTLITGLLFVVSLFLHRPVDDILILQSVVYFMPVYLIGIMASEKKDAIYTQLKGKEIYLLLTAIALATIQAALGKFSSYQKPPFVYDGIDIMLFQKVALCFFFMVWLHRFEQVNSKAINILASTSFAIYFTHGYFMQIIREVVSAFNIEFYSPWFWYPIVTTGMILACLMVAISLKRLLPNYSRYLIGY